MRRFHEIWYADPNTWPKNTFLGIQTLQNPMDSWVTNEILAEVKPDYMIECGSWKGGSAAMWALTLEQVNPAARVLSIDIEDRMQEARKLPIVQRSVEFILSSSTDAALVAKLTERVQGKTVVVLLDSDHSKAHVLAELRSYAPLVSVGSYMIVQDSNITVTLSCRSSARGRSKRSKSSCRATTASASTRTASACASRSCPTDTCSGSSSGEGESSGAPVSVCRRIRRPARQAA